MPQRLVKTGFRASARRLMPKKSQAWNTLSEHSLDKDQREYYEVQFIGLIADAKGKSGKNGLSKRSNPLAEKQSEFGLSIGRFVLSN